MTRLQKIEEIPMGDVAPLQTLDDLLGEYDFAKAARGTYLRRDPDGLVLWYETTPLCSFKEDGFVLDFRSWHSPSALSRARAVLERFGYSIERHGAVVSVVRGEESIIVQGATFIPYRPRQAEEARCG